MARMRDAAPSSRPHAGIAARHKDVVQDAAAGATLGGEAVADARVGADVAGGSPARLDLARAGWRCGCAGRWVSSAYSGPQTSTSSARWVISRPRLRTSVRSRSNSIGVRWTSSPSRRTSRAARSISQPVDVDRRLVRRRAGRGAAPPAAARPARAARTAWSRSRRRRPPARGPSASSSPTAREHDDRHLGSTRAAARHTSMPSPSGSTRSTIAASGGRTAARSSASSAVVGRRRPRSRPRAGRPSARAGSAARRRTTSTRGGRSWCRRVDRGVGRARIERELDHERRALAGQRLDRRRGRRWPRRSRATIASPRPEPRWPSAAPAGAVEGLEDPRRARRAGCPGPRSTIAHEHPRADRARAHGHRAGRPSSARAFSSRLANARSSWAASARTSGRSGSIESAKLLAAPGRRRRRAARSTSSTDAPLAARLGRARPPAARGRAGCRPAATAAWPRP